MSYSGKEIKVTNQTKHRSLHRSKFVIKWGINWNRKISNSNPMSKVRCTTNHFANYATIKMKMQNDLSQHDLKVCGRYK